jgi:hypothetical protein
MKIKESMRLIWQGLQIRANGQLMTREAQMTIE